MGVGAGHTWECARARSMVLWKTVVWSVREALLGHDMSAVLRDRWVRAAFCSVTMACAVWMGLSKRPPVETWGLRWCCWNLSHAARSAGDENFFAWS